MRNSDNYREIISNPITFTEKILNMQLRPFQKEIFECKSNKILLRICRRGGKSYTLILWVLWFMMTNSNKRVLLVAPYDNQVIEFFAEMDKIIDGNKAVRDSIKRRTNKPHLRSFKNGSSIKGFPSGVRSKHHADSARGHGCDALILDEADRLQDEDYDTLLAMLMEKPNIPIFLASTPTGKRGRYYTYATQKELGFVEFHRNCWQAIPGWNEERDHEARTVLFPTEFAYRTEASAEFGEPAEGVFKQKFLNKEFQDYYYAKIDSTHMLKTIGVDWDKYSSGPTLVVCGFELEKKRITVIDRISIPLSEFTLDVGVSKVIELNKKYNPDYIYLDRGYGEMQIEILQKYGKKFPESGLLEKILGVHFGSSVDVYNDVTKIIERCNVKHWIINQLVIFVERGAILFSTHDKELRRQMDNFRVMRRNETTGPVYVDYDDHLIMALGLAVLAIVDNVLKIGKKIRRNAGVMFTNIKMDDSMINVTDYNRTIVEPMSIKGIQYASFNNISDSKRLTRRKFEQVCDRTRALGF